MEMKTAGVVEGLFVCVDKGLPMASVAHVRAIEGRGIQGDRYSLGRGKYSDKPGKERQISVISVEAIDTANRGLALQDQWLPEQTRRNIVVSGIDMSEEWLEYEPLMMIGSAVLQLTDNCRPCNRPDELANKQGFAQAFHGLGGLRAVVLVSGDISVGDSVELVK